MAESKVLYIHVSGLSSEILKNLVLAGIRAVLCDGRPFAETAEHTPTVFINREDRSNKKLKTATVAEVWKEKVEEINPLLGECETHNTAVADLTEEFLAQFRIVICSRLSSLQDAVRISQIVTAAGHQFYMADCFGLNGAAALDLGAAHTYRPEQGKKLLDVEQLKTHVPLETMLMKVPLQDATNRFHKAAPPDVWIQYRCLLEFVDQKGTWPTKATADDFVTTIQTWIAETSPALLDNHAVLTKESLQQLAAIATAEVAPVCSVLGGVLGNEIIKAISGKGAPANNTLLLDGQTCKVWNFLVQPKAQK